jgi:hypothetical protein
MTITTHRKSRHAQHKHKPSHSFITQHLTIVHHKTQKYHEYILGVSSPYITEGKAREMYPDTDMIPKFTINQDKNHQASWNLCFIVFLTFMNDVINHHSISLWPTTKRDHKADKTHKVFHPVSKKL